LKRKSRDKAAVPSTKELTEVHTKYLEAFFYFFKQGWCIVNFPHENFRFNRNLLLKNVEITTNHLYEIDLVEIEQGSKIMIDQDQVSEKLLIMEHKKIVKRLEDNRINLLHVFPILPIPDVYDIYENTSLLKSNVGKQFFIKCKEFEFAVGNYEPFICCLTVYNFDKKTKSN